MRVHLRERVRTLLEMIASIIHLLLSLALIALVLLRAGKGGGMGDMFGGGMSSGNVGGGSTVAEKNLDRLTVIVAIIFTISVFTLTWALAA